MYTVGCQKNFLNKCAKQHRNATNFLHKTPNVYSSNDRYAIVDWHRKRQHFETQNSDFHV